MNNADLLRCFKKKSLFYGSERKKRDQTKRVITAWFVIFFRGSANSLSQPVETRIPRSTRGCPLSRGNSWRDGTFIPCPSHFPSALHLVSPPPPSAYDFGHPHLTSTTGNYPYVLHACTTHTSSAHVPQPLGGRQWDLGEIPYAAEEGRSRPPWILGAPWPRGRARCSDSSTPENKTLTRSP
jgi:hypothetical protein